MRRLLFIISAIILYSCTATTPPPAQTEPTPPPAVKAEKPTQKAKGVVEPNKRIIPVKMVQQKPEVTVNASLHGTGLLGSQIIDGMTLLFNKIMREEKNTPVRCSLNMLEDHDEIPEFILNVGKQIKRSPLFLGTLGTSALRTLMPKIHQGELLALFPFDGAKKYRINPPHNVVFFRADYEAEIEALITYSRDTLNRQKFAIFYEASDWGESALEATKNVLKRLNMELVASVSYPYKTLAVTRGVDELVAKSPDAIICFANVRPAYNFIRGLVNKGLTKTVILGPSTLYSIREPLKRSRGIDLVTSSTVPDPITSKLQIAQEYRKDMKKYNANKKLTPMSFEAYIIAALTYEVLKDTPQPFTIEKIVETIEGLKKVQFKGLDINFDPKTRTLFNQVFISHEVKGKTIETEKEKS